VLTVVIPTFNEARNIRGTIEELDQVLSRIGLARDYEVIVVDDHSSDSTYQEVVAIGAARVNCIRLSRRSGSHVALRAGIAQSKGDAVLCISADGQDDPEVLENMLQKWHAGAHVVWALRRNRNRMSVRTVSSFLFYRMLRLLMWGGDGGIESFRADFFLLDKKVVEALKTCRENKTSLFGLVAWVGFDQTYVEYQRRDRRTGRSKWSLARRLELATDWIVAFSSIPLKLIPLVGILLLLSGLIYAIFLWVSSRAPAAAMGGCGSLLVVALVVGGIQTLMLGLLGEYLWRDLSESRDRPLYFIEKSTLGASWSPKEAPGSR
jgi:dolichol-phosphate mannosyltransferase